MLIECPPVRQDYPLAEVKSPPLPRAQCCARIVRPEAGTEGLVGGENLLAQLPVRLLELVRAAGSQLAPSAQLEHAGSLGFCLVATSARIRHSSG